MVSFKLILVDDGGSATATQFLINHGTGNVGIGTTNPSSKLEVHSGTNDSCLHLTSTDQYVDLKMSDDTTTDGGIRVSSKGDDLLLQRGMVMLESE